MGREAGVIGTKSAMKKPVKVLLLFASVFGMAAVYNALQEELTPSRDKEYISMADIINNQVKIKRVERDLLPDSQMTSKGVIGERMFKCSNQVDTRPISESLRCDGQNDCGDWSDEMGCDCKSPKLYKCAGSGKCILKEMLCDGWNECGDWEDEICSCTSRQFNCFQRCIANTEVCGGQLLCGTNLQSWSEELEDCDCTNCLPEFS